MGSIREDETNLKRRRAGDREGRGLAHGGRSGQDEAIITTRRGKPPAAGALEQDGSILSSAWPTSRYGTSLCRLRGESAGAPSFVQGSRVLWGHHADEAARFGISDAGLGLGVDLVLTPGKVAR
jgi:hypothetical protein